MISKSFYRILICVAVCGAAPVFAADGNAEKTKQLIATLRAPDASLRDKARACQQAGEFGTAEIVPALAALLDDEKLAAYARSGLENIADPAAAAALRTALGALQGDRLIGVVNSLGVLRDEKATGALQQLAADPGKGVVKEALLALGRISTDESIATVRMALRSGPAQFRADAAAACLLAAEGQFAIGKAEIATSIYDDVRAADLPKPLQAAALRGAIMCRKDGAVPLLLEQLRSNDAVLRGVALRAARELPGRQITAALITELARSTPSLQALLVGVLVDRRDPVVLKPVESLAGSPSAEVRRAVIQALATIGASSSVPLLLESLASGSETESAAALLSLSRIKADGADAMMLKKLPALAPPVRARLIVVLGDRNASGIVPEMLALAANPDATVATAAFKTLAVLAGPDDLAKLLPVALAAPDGPVRSQAERTIYLTLLRALADRRVEPMLKAFAAATRPADKQTLIRILGLLGTQPACAAIQGALNDADASVRDTAFRALVDWPDAAAMPWLLATLQSNSPQRQRTLAWRGAIRIATREHTAAPAVEWFQQLNKTAAAQAEKRLLIAGLIELAAERSEGLEMLRPYLDDPAVAAETASMAVQFGKRVEEGRSKVPQPAVLKALLERVAAGDADKPLREEAAALAKQIRGPSAAAGGATPEFRPLFNGRNFDGWEGDTARSFRIVDGAIVGGNLQDKIPRNEFLATTRSYTNFILRAECKLAGPANGGIQIRTQRIPNHNEVRGYQADMSAGKDGGYWGCLYDESRRNKVLARPARDVILKALKPDDWNLYEIRCEGRRIQLFVNGQQTVDYTEPDESIPLSGIIAVQIHGGPPSEAWYRNLIIAELP